jgi:membrane protein
MSEKRVWLKWEFIRRIINKLQADDISGLAAQLSYFFLLSLFPLFIFLFTLVAYLPYSQDEILRTVQTFAPAKSMALIETNLNHIMQGNGKLLSFGIFGTIWSASNGLNAIISAFNRAYDVKETRSYFIARGMSIILTFAMIFVFLVALLLPVFGKQIGVFLFSEFGFSEEFVTVWNTLRWMISSLVLFIVFIMLYWVAPNKKLKCVSVLPGAVFATVGWVGVSFVFSFYVDKIGYYNTAYGSLGGVIVLMIWFYLSGLIIIMGGEINALVGRKKKPQCT